MTGQHYSQMGISRQLIYLFGLWFGFTILGALLAIVLILAFYGMPMLNNVLTQSNTSAPGFIGAFRILVAVGSSLTGFLAPAIVFAYWVVGEPDEYIGARNRTPAILFLVATVFILCFLPTVDITAYFNQKMTLPPSLGWLDKWIHDMETTAMGQFKILLDMKGPADLIISLLIVAVCPAIAEEFFFRGCVQPIFMRATRNTHAAVWITAFIFSFIHFEFLGFLPRMLLGAGMGYLFAWSGSIWSSVLVHFINNGFSVVIVYLYQHKMINADPDGGQPMFSQMWIYALAFVASIGVLYLYHQITIKKQLLAANGEELGEDIHVD